MILESFLATVLVKWRRKKKIISQCLEIGFHTDQILAYQLNCSPAFSPIVCLKITCMELMYFKDFPEIHWEIKTEKGGKIVGWLDSSSPGQDDSPGGCKTGHCSAWPLCWGRAWPYLCSHWHLSKNGELPPLLALTSRKEQAVPQLCVVQQALWGGAMARKCVPWLADPWCALLPISCLCLTKVLAVICRVFHIPYCSLNQFCEWFISEQFKLFPTGCMCCTICFSSLFRSRYF